METQKMMCMTYFDKIYIRIDTLKEIEEYTHKLNEYGKIVGRMLENNELNDEINEYTNKMESKLNKKYIEEVFDNNLERFTTIFNRLDENVLSVLLNVSYDYARKEYNFFKEANVGIGRADLILVPYRTNKPGIIFELKVDSSCLEAIKQIKEKDYDILYLTDYIDEFVLSAIHEYDKKTFVNIEKDDLDLETEEEKENTKKINEENTDLLKEMKEVIPEVKEVRFTNKLKTYPVCLTSVGDISIEMQKVFAAMPNTPNMKAETVLEINEKHPIANKLKDLYQNDKDTFKKYTKILYSEAKMIAGLSIDNPTEISNLICDVIAK